MKIECTKKIGVCFCCKKKFDEGFEIDFDKRFFNNIKFCQSCLLELYKLTGKHFVPKSPKSIYKNLKIFE